MSKSLKINALLNTIRTFLGIVFPVITFPYASRILMPEGIGRINFVNTIVSYFSLIASLGIESYAIREAAKLKTQPEKLNIFTKEMLTINFISTGVAYVLFFITLTFVPKLSGYRNLLLLSCISILFTTLGVEWLYKASENFAYITIRTIVFQIISIILLFSFVRSKDDLPIYLGIGIISSVGANIFNFIHARKIINLKSVKIQSLKHHLKPIFLLFTMTLVTSLYTLFDATMLGFLSSDAEVGFYAAATKINKMVLTMLTAACAVLLPRLSFYVTSNRKDFFSLFYKSLSFLICFSLPATVGLNILSEPIMLLFSGKLYLPAVPVMKIMNPIIIAIGLSGLIGIHLFVPLKKEKLTFISVCIGACVNFVSNLLLIPRYGALGAGVATLLAEILVTVSQMIMARKLINFKSIFVHFLQCTVATMGMAVFLLWLRKIIVGRCTIIVISIVSGMLIYSTMLYVMRNKFYLTVLSGIRKRRRVDEPEINNKRK